MSGLHRTHDQDTSGHDQDQDQDQDTTRHGTPPEHTTEKRGTQEKICYCWEIYTQKRKKSKKKFVNMEKGTTFAEETTKSKQYENTNIKNLQE